MIIGHKLFKTAGVLFAAFCIALLAGCGNTYEPFEIEKVHISIPGISREYRFIFASDMHIDILNEEVYGGLDEANREAYKGLVGERITSFSNNGSTSEENWKKISEYVSKRKPDGVLLGGDIVDFCSEADCQAAKAGIESMKVPYMYVRSDHDTEPYYAPFISKESAVAIQNSVAPNDAVLCMEYPEFAIVGWNNSHLNFPKEGVDMIKEFSAQRKPVILLAHIPIRPLEDESLEEMVLSLRGKNILWAKEDVYYQADENTKELLDLITSGNSSVVEILCGHIHYSWDGYVCEGVHEHVFAPGYLNCIGEVTVGK